MESSQISVETVALEKPVWSSAEGELYDIVNYQMPEKGMSSKKETQSSQHN